MQGGRESPERPLKNCPKSQILMRVGRGRKAYDKSSRLADDSRKRTEMRNELLAILRCPDDRSKLSEAEAGLVSRLNAAISARHLRNRAGQIVEYSLEGGLVRAAGDLLYPIVDQIPVMLHGEAIPLAQLGDGNGASRTG